MEEENNSEHCDSDERERPNTKYRLVGVVVHSGQASGGHYYSYIRCETDYMITFRSLGMVDWVTLMS